MIELFQHSYLVILLWFFIKTNSFIYILPTFSFPSSNLSIKKNQTNAKKFASLTTIEPALGRKLTQPLIEIISRFKYVSL